MEEERLKFEDYIPKPSKDKVKEEEDAEDDEDEIDRIKLANCRMFAS